MNAPDEIHLQWYGDQDLAFAKEPLDPYSGDITWSVERIHAGDIPYVRRYAKIPLWMLSALDTNGNTTLRAICTDRTLANRYRDALTHAEAFEHESIVRAWITPTDANHLYGAIAT